MTEQLTCDDNLDTIAFKYDDDLGKITPTTQTLTNVLVASTIYRDAITKDKQLYQRFDILRTIISHALRKNSIKGLDNTLKTKHQLNETGILAWIYEFNFVKEQTQKFYNELEHGYTTRLRGEYPTLLAELLYIKYPERWQTLPVSKTL